MPKSAIVAFASLRTCLVNLPSSVCGALVNKGISPQSLAILLAWPSQNPTTTSRKTSLQKAYVGWSGFPAQLAPAFGGSGRGAKSALSEEERVEIDPVFARNLGLREGVEVSITVLPSLPVASSINVQPLTPDDWEILELQASFLEDNLLSQVRAVSPDQLICVWVAGSGESGGGGSMVTVRVDSFSVDDGDSEPEAALVATDTEIFVAPKVRATASSLTSDQVSANAKHNVMSSSTSANASVKKNQPSQALNASIPESPNVEVVKKKLFRLLPLAFNQYDGKSRALEKAAGQTDRQPSSSPSVLVNPRTFARLVNAYPSTRCSLSVCPRPGSNSQHREEKRPAANESQSRTNTSGRRFARSPPVYFASESKVPVGHVWIDEKTRTEMGLDEDGGIPSFDLIRFLPVKPPLRNETNGAVDGTTSPTSPRTPNPPRLLKPTRQTETLAGVEDKVERCKLHIANVLFTSLVFHEEVRKRSGSPGLLVSGSAGSGKTALINRVAREIALAPDLLCHVKVVDCAKHTDERVPHLKSLFKDWFDEACWHAPSVLFLDNIDSLIPAEVEHIDPARFRQIVEQFYSACFSAIVQRSVVLVATSKSTTSLHNLLTSSHLLSERVALKPPDKNARREIINALIAAKSESSSLRSESLNAAALGAQTEGYLPADLRDLVDRAIHQAAIRSYKSQQKHVDLTLDDFITAQADFVPLSLRDVKLQKSEVQWADIGGLHETRRTLRETLEWPTKYAAIFASCPLRLRSGLLLYGYPGCGKTLLASAVAKECGLNFISVKGPELLNKYIGASEKSVRDLFERAQAAKPCVLFFDEFDSIAPKRGHDSTGVTDRVVNQMLTQMDGAEGLDGVYVLAATSRPDLIDPALLRPGRLDKSLLCDMPSFEDRLEILQACSRKIGLGPDVDLSDCADATEGFSGADLQAVMYNAHLDAIHSSVSASMSNGQADGKHAKDRLVYTSSAGSESDGPVLSRAEQTQVEQRLATILDSVQSSTASSKSMSAKAQTRKPNVVSMQNIRQALDSTRPSVPREELRRLSGIYNEFVSGRSTSSGFPSGEASLEIGGRSSLM